MGVTQVQATLLRKIALGDTRLLNHLLSDDDLGTRVLDQRDVSLLRIAALVALGANTRSYQREVDAAISSGATPAEAVDVLVRVASVVGSSHTIEAAPKLALALGFDLDASLESLEPDLS